MDITTLSDEELKQLAIDLGIDFDWGGWLSPRYKLIETIKQDERLNALSMVIYGQSQPRSATQNDTTVNND